MHDDQLGPAGWFSTFPLYFQAIVRVVSTYKYFFHPSTAASIGSRKITGGTLDILKALNARVLFVSSIHVEGLFPSSEAEHDNA